MNRDLFEYDEQNHLGYYNGKLIPSVTQLLDILLPLDDSIPEDRLTNAAKRGTDIHALLENLNESIVARNISANDYACKSGSQEVYDYASILNAYHLRPLKYEEMVFLLDENGEPICYGHYDCIVGAYADIDPFENGQPYMLDYKTTSVFDKRKTSLQTHIYRVAFNQQGILQLNKHTFGLHLRDGVKLIPLKDQEDDYIISLCKELRVLFEERNNKQWHTNKVIYSLKAIE